MHGSLMLFKKLEMNQIARYKNWNKKKTKNENISFSNILYKSLTGPKPLRVRFDEIDGFTISW